MDQICSSASQEISHILVNRVYKRVPPVPVLNQINRFQGLPPISWRFTVILFSPLRLDVPTRLCLWGFPTENLYELLYSHIHATCPDHLTLFWSDKINNICGVISVIKPLPYAISPVSSYCLLLMSHIFSATYFHTPSAHVVFLTLRSLVVTVTCLLPWIVSFAWMVPTYIVNTPKLT
jgi:hypothetical protein